MKTKKYHGQTSKVTQLPLRIKGQADKMLMPDKGQRKTYQEISDWLKKRGYTISKSSLCRYVQYRQTNKGKGPTAFYNNHNQTQGRIELNLLKLYEGVTKKASESLDPQDIETVLRLEKILTSTKEPNNEGILEISQEAHLETNGAAIKCTKDALPFISFIAKKEQEYFLCVTLNNAKEVIESKVVTIGLLNNNQIHPREVFVDAISKRAATVILAHNHPSGSLNPSSNDIIATRQLVEAGKIIGIEVLDHIIISTKGYLSMKGQGYF